jgi:mono/diheme cytochrome c family protein
MTMTGYRTALSLCVAILCGIPTALRAGSADGRRLYVQQCARCHGNDGGGDGSDAALFATPPPKLRAGILDTQTTADAVRRILDSRSDRLEVDVPRLRAQAKEVDAVVAYLQRLPEVDWPVVDPGQVLFVDRCSTCHGPSGSPGPDAMLPAGVRRPRSLSDPLFQRGMSDADMMIAVRHGRAGMPALTPRLSEEQARRVTAFVRLLSPGYATYSSYCAACHGDHGVGTGSFAESYAAPTVIFDTAYFKRNDPEALRTSAWHMVQRHKPSMPHFRGTLTEAEARAIVEYLRGLRPDR